MGLKTFLDVQNSWYLSLKHFWWKKFYSIVYYNHIERVSKREGYMEYQKQWTLFVQYQSRQSSYKERQRILGRIISKVLWVCFNQFMTKQQDDISDNVKVYYSFAQEEWKYMMKISGESNNKTVLKRHGRHEKNVIHF